MEKRIREGETLEETHQNVLNPKEEYAGKVDRLLKEATGKRAKSEVFDETRLTKIVYVDSKVMVLQLKQDRYEPVWRPTQWQSRRRSSMLLISVTRGGLGRWAGGGQGSLRR